MNTQNSEKKKINWFRAIRPIALVLVLVMLLTYATYSWMKRDWTPAVHEENIQIVAGSSLVFLFNGEQRDKNVSVSELVPELKDFVFKSVSNYSGKSDDFFALQYSPKGKFFDKFKHISISEITDSTDDSNLNDENYQTDTRIDYTMLGKKHGYIELTFAVKAPTGSSKHVMLDPSSCIKASMVQSTTDVNGDTKVDANDKVVSTTGQTAVEAMRVSITVPETETTTKTIVFVPKSDGLAQVHKGINNEVDSDGKYIADGVDRYEDKTEDNVNNPSELTTKIGQKDLILQNNDTKTLFGEGEKVGYTSTVTDDDYYLFTLEDDVPKQVIVRIWLEGEDEKCTDDLILGGELDILVKLGAVDC